MDPQEFEIRLTRGERGASVSVIGELDVATVGEFRSAIDDALTDSTHVDIDLTDLEFIDSSGLQELLAIHNASTERRFTYQLLATPPIVQRTFALTGLDRVLAFA